MRAPPHVIGCKGQHPEGAADPIAEVSVLKKRAVSAVVLDREEAQEEGGVEQGKRDRQPIADRHGPPCKYPQKHEGTKGHDQFKGTAHWVRRAVFCENAGPFLRRTALGVLLNSLGLIGHCLLFHVLCRSVI